MPTKLKTKPAVAEKAMTITPEMSLAEQVVQAKDAYDKAKVLIREFDKVVKTLKEHMPVDADPMKPFRFEGLTGDVEFSAAGSKRTLEDVKAFHEAVGDDVFYAIATVPLKEVDRYLSDLEQETMVTKVHSGPRKMSVKSK